MQRFIRIIAVLATAVLLPATVFAQASITGTVRDTSNAVLPGVTVDATSPALIAPRSVVTETNGVYRILDIPPGTYTVTYTLPGFTRVVRDGIVVSGTAVFTINAEMRVGAVSESITVTGETPVVDVQSVKREMVLSSDIIAAIPATRAVGSLLNLTPGLTVDNNGLQNSPTMTFFSARGGQVNEGRMTINGMTVAAPFNGGGVSSYALDSVNVDEVSVVVSGGLGETDVGGPVMNIVPRAGGNNFRGSAFLNNAGDWSRGNNLDDSLRAVGIRETPGIIKSYDANVSYGGPIKKDRLWFFGSYRKLDTSAAVEGIVANANAHNLARWDWLADNSATGRRIEGREMFIGRLTAQLGAKHKISFNHETQYRCEGSPLKVETNGCHTRGSDWIGAGGATSSPESNTTASYIDFPYYVTQALWTAPMTSKLLLEAGFSRFSYADAGGPGRVAPDGIFDISVTEQSAAVNPATGLRYVPRANYVYRALAGYSDNFSNTNNWRASMSYVSGAHNMKVGYQGTYLIRDSGFVRNPTTLSYRFNQGVPNQFTMNIPAWTQADRTQSASIYIQDTWTRNRLTLSGAVRYDRAWSYSPAEHNGTTETSRLNRSPITFSQPTPSVQAFNDITPRIGVAYDVFGNGKTALKFNMGHYLDAAANDSAYTRNNPAARIVRTLNRNWSDTNGNKVVDCDLLNFAAQSAVDTCAAVGGNDLNFGGVSGNLTQVNPNYLKGWGVRQNDWQWGVTVQQELRPRVSLEVGYARRWWHGLENGVTDNLVRNPSQYDAWTITAPTDPRLPNGGGYPITLYAVTAAANAIPARNYVTFETDFGPERINYWQGLDITLNARLRNSLTFQAGTSTGREVEDDCATRVLIDSPDPRNCRDADPYQTTLRGLMSYNIPKIGVQVSATLRSQPANERSTAAVNNGAAWNVPNTVVQTLLGRLPAGGLATGNTTVPLLDNDHRLYEPSRRTQIDMRFAKILRFGATRADIGVDLGNLLNTNYATSYDSTYQYSAGNTLAGGTWNNPTAVYTPRFVRVNFGFNF